MNTTLRNRFSFSSSGKDYFDQLPKEVQDMVKKLLLEKFESAPDCWPYGDEKVEELECRSRDGFIAAGHNHGGLRVKGFTDLYSFSTGGDLPNHEGAAKEIQRQIDYSESLIRDEMWNKHEKKLRKAKIKKKDINYSTMQDIELEEEYSDLEQQYLADSESSIMFELQFMYHGCKDGVHSASISAAVNTEGPYHRSSISWAPNIFCEGAKELEITWKTNKSLEKKLSKALDETIKEIF